MDGESPIISDTGWRQLDPRKIDLDREVGWIVTPMLSIGWLVGLGVLSLIDNAPGWLWWGVALLWAPFTVAVAALSYQWPPIEYRHTRYRVDDELDRDRARCGFSDVDRRPALARAAPGRSARGR